MTSSDLERALVPRLTTDEARAWADTLRKRDPLSFAGAQALALALDDYAAMRAICGPRCPKCGRFMKAEHDTQWMHQPDAFMPKRRPYEPCLTYAELIADHPEIAAEMGLTS